MATPTQTDQTYFRPIEVDGSPVPTQGPVETITQAQSNQGAWGSAGFQNLTNGARASGSVKSAHSLLPAADLDWDPVIIPLTDTQGRQVDPKVVRGVARSDTGIVVGAVGSRYRPLPHRKLADYADALAGMDGVGLAFGNAGHKHGGALPFIQLEGMDDSLPGVGQIRTMITLMTSHDGSLPICAGLSKTVVVCNNTYAMALAGLTRWQIRHLPSGEKLLEDMLELLQNAKQYSIQWRMDALKLMSLKFSDNRMRALTHLLVEGDSKRSDNQRTELMDSWYNAPGGMAGTSWGAAQAVTHYTSHKISSSEGLVFGEGTGSKIQNTAWWCLTEEEGEAALNSEMQKLQLS